MRGKVLSITIGATIMASSTAALAQKACALVTKADAQSLTSAKLGNANESSIADMNMTSCTYLGPGKDSTPAVLVTVVDAAKIYPGVGTASGSTTTI